MSWKDTLSEILENTPRWLSYLWTAFLFILLVGIAVSTCSCGVLKQDNDLEEWIEEVLKDQSGIDIDFSGDSPECSFKKRSIDLPIVKF